MEVAQLNRRAKRNEGAQSPNKRRERLLVAILLAAHWALAVGSVRNKSATFDEPGHLVAGVSNWRTGDFRLLPEHPPLPHLWAALPVVIGDYREPAWDGPDWWRSQVWKLGRQYLYELGNDADALLWRARAAMALFSVALGGLVWWWSRSLFGPGGGLLSLAVFALSPTMLAHAPLVTTDTAVSLFFLAAVTAIWHGLHRITLASVALAGLAVAGLVLSKVSGVLIAPMAAGLAAVRLLSRTPTVVGRRAIAVAPGTVLYVRWKQLVIWLFAAAVAALIVLALIWAFYGCRYSAMHAAQSGRDEFFTPAPLPPGQDAWDYKLEGLGLKGRLIAWARDCRLLPESYLFGFASTVKHAEFRAAYFNGETSVHGWRTFFPYCFAVKTPLPLVALLLLAASARAGRDPADAPIGAAWAQGFYRTAPLWTLFVVYWVTAINSNLNIGHRHILPVYPVLFILAGRAALWLQVGSRALRALPAVACGLFVLASAVQFPHYLSYFNLLVGGSRQAYNHLVDSSLDWGQDLPGLKRWLDIREGADVAGDSGVAPVYLSYFGTAKPSYYGIDARALPSYLPWQGATPFDWSGGIYCISATTLQQIGLMPECRWTEALEAAYQRVRAGLAAPAAGGSPADLAYALKLRFARLCAFLRQREPDAHVGYSILIFNVSAEEVNRALSGEPPEQMPDRAENLQRLADQAFETGARAAAAEFYFRLLELEPADEQARRRSIGNHAAALAGLGRAQEAARALRQGLERYPRDTTLNNNLAWLLATHPNPHMRDGAEAVRRARMAVEATGHRDPNTLDTLAAALAEAGRFDEAVEQARAALRLAEASGDAALAAELESRLHLYRRSVPYREP